MSESLSNLTTPVLLLDRERLTSNLNRMRKRATGLGVHLRPHMKTAKSVEIARLSQPDGLTVSTLAEATFFANAGYVDILYAVSPTKERAAQVAALRLRGIDVQVVVDSEEQLQALDGGHRVWIEIDCDGRRGGIAPDAADLVELSESISRRHELAGVMTHAGGAYAGRSAQAIADWAERERAAVVLAADRIRSAGLSCPGVSVGSTPTATHALDLTGVTEMRPGVYMFGDTFQAGIGSCHTTDIAVSVLATVIGLRSDGYVIDAGALALSLDRSTSITDYGYGMVCDLEGAQIGSLRVDQVTQEHGVIVDSGRRSGLGIGARVKVLPNHACMTAACHREYQVVSGDRAEETWQRCQGW